MKRVVARLAAGAAVLVVFAVAAGSAAASGGLVISQVYGGGGNSGATYKNDFIELYNRGTTPVDVSGWSVQYAATTGVSWQRTNLAGSIAAGARYVVKEAAGAGGTADLPQVDATGTINMSGTAGKVVLASNQTTFATGTSCPSAGVVDLVGYGTTTNCSETAPTGNLSNANAAIRKGDGAQDTDSNVADFDIAPAAPAGGGGGGGGGGGATPLKIDQIQGAGQFSPHVGEKVSTTGVVTALKSNGFFVEDPVWDADPATSEGVFVFGATTGLAAGDSVRVTATVTEFISSGSGDLPETELSSPTTTVLGPAPIPAPVLIGSGGLTPPGQSVPQGIAFDESLEGMLVELDDLQAVGPTNSFGETWVVPNFGAGASPLSARGGVVLTADDQNPEKFLVDDDVFTGNMPAVDVGARSAGAHVGVLDYAFDNYTIHLLDQPAFTPTPNTRETTSVTTGADRLRVATFNVENLSPGDPAAKFAGLADVLVNRLGAPDIVALEEVQDNDGPTDDGVVDSSVTLATLAQAVVAAGGPQYAYTWINPVNDQDGGQPGGNIRVAFFYRTDVPGLQLAPGAAGGSTDANAVVGSGDSTSLLYNPGRVDPASGAWTSSRKPLAAEFLFNGRKVFVIANHFNSKLGDDPMWGADQPPVNGSEAQRHQQANEVGSFVQSLLGADPGANVVVLGDLNDFQFSQTVSILEGAGLHDLVKDLPVSEQYTYVFAGNSQAIDHILVGGSLTGVDRDYDVVHVNSEFSTQVSDHEPQIVSLALPQVRVDAPAATADEGSTVPLHATANVPTIRWDLDNDGVFETVGPDATVAAADGPATLTIPVEAVAADGTTAVSHATITVLNVAPTATFDAPGSVVATSPIALSLTAASDPSAADVAAGFQYAFDCGSGYGAWSSSATATCATDDAVARTVRGAIRDKDGGVREYTATVRVTIDVDSLCGIVTNWAKNGGEANSLCVKLRHGQIAAFDNEVDAQSGKAFTAEQAATLERLAAQL
jgi:hypothetical protein